MQAQFPSWLYRRLALGNLGESLYEALSQRNVLAIMAATRLAPSPLASETFVLTLDTFAIEMASRSIAALMFVRASFLSVIGI